MELDRTLTPPRPGPKFEFITPKNVKPERYVCLSTWIWAHHVHWTGGRTQPCTMTVGLEGQVVQSCDHCKAQCPTRWKGYLHVWRPDLKGEAFLCLTPVAGYDLIEQLGEEKNLRGLSLDVWRAGKHATAALVVRVNPSFARQSFEKPELDPAPYLATVFRKQKPLALPR